MHCGYVYRRYRSRYSDGCCSGDRCSAGGRETQHSADTEKASGKERWDAFKDAFWGFLMPVIILGGIYGSVFTPTEAAAVSVVYGLFVGIFIYKEIKLKDLWDLMVDSAKTTGGIMLIVASASLFSLCLHQSLVLRRQHRIFLEALLITSLYSF
ncbi:MAG: TRAP transporter large permease subunit [Lachnospiraceae bacterium]